MDIKLICMDLDGTTLQKDHCSFSPRLDAALEAAYDRGVTIVPVTGRQFGVLPPAITRAPRWLNWVSLCNGAELRPFHKKERLQYWTLARPELEQLLALAGKYGFAIEFSSDSVLHLTRNDLERELQEPSLDFHCNVVLKNHGRVVDSLAVLLDMPVEKVNLVCIPEESRAALVAELETIAVTATLSGRRSMEVTHREASKGNALMALCRHLGILPENTLALGDSENDVSMLRCAGLGIAMGNATADALAVADGVTAANDQDGAAIAIEKYVLN